MGLDGWMDGFYPNAPTVLASPLTTTISPLFSLLSLTSPLLSVVPLCSLTLPLSTYGGGGEEEGSLPGESKKGETVSGLWWWQRGSRGARSRPSDRERTAQEDVTVVAPGQSM